MHGHSCLHKSYRFCYKNHFKTGNILLNTILFSTCLSAFAWINTKKSGHKEVAIDAKEILLTSLQFGVFMIFHPTANI